MLGWVNCAVGCDEPESKPLEVLNCGSGDGAAPLRSGFVPSPATKVEERGSQHHSPTDLGFLVACGDSTHWCVAPRELPSSQLSACAGLDTQEGSRGQAGGTAEQVGECTEG